MACLPKLHSPTVPTVLHNTYEFRCQVKICLILPAVLSPELLSNEQHQKSSICFRNWRSVGVHVCDGVPSRAQSDICFARTLDPKWKSDVYSKKGPP